MTRVPKLIAALMLLLLATAMESPAETPKESAEVPKLKTEYLQKRKDALQLLTARYRTELEMLSKRLMQKNDLEGAVFIKKEMDELKEGKETEREPKEPEDLTRLRRDYAQRSQDAMRPVNARYQQDLETVAKKLMQTSDLEGAAAAKLELDALRASGGRDGMAALKKAILANHWSWANKPGDRGVEMTFKPDGIVRHVGMRAEWKITGLRDVSLALDNGDKMILRFDAEIKSYRAVGRIHRGVIWQ